MRTEFENFHRANPQIYAEFAEIAKTWIGNGRKRVSARAIFHVLRNRHGKLNDHYSPFYARLFLRQNPQHYGAFELRNALADMELTLDDFLTQE